MAGEMLDKLYTWEVMKMVEGSKHLPWCLRMAETKLKKLLDTEAGRHLVNSRKELLLAVRALVDQKIAWLDRLGQEAEAKQVEVE